MKNIVFDPAYEADVRRLFAHPREIDFRVLDQVSAYCATNPNLPRQAVRVIEISLNLRGGTAAFLIPIVETGSSVELLRLVLAAPSGQAAS